jgi:hypothetical protein
VSHRNREHRNRVHISLIQRAIPGHLRAGCDLRRHRTGIERPRHRQRIEDVNPPITIYIAKRRGACATRTPEHQSAGGG